MTKLRFYSMHTISTKIYRLKYSSIQSFYNMIWAFFHTISWLDVVLYHRIFLKIFQYSHKLLDATFIIACIKFILIITFDINQEKINKKIIDAHRYIEYRKHKNKKESE